MRSNFKYYFAHSIPKVKDTTNDDSYAASLTSLAVSDGATMAFNSSVWSRILTRLFVRYPNIPLEEIVLKAKKIFDRYHKLFYFHNQAIPWNVIEVYEKGSFASLLGIEILKDSRIKITAVGDSITVLVSPDKTKSFPYESASDFPLTPVLLSTNLASNTFMTEDNFSSKSIKTLKIKDPENTIIICMTDAIAIWFLSDPEKAMNHFKEILNEPDAMKQKELFESLVIKERDNMQMKQDDSTLLIAGIQHD